MSVTSSTLTYSVLMAEYRYLRSKPSSLILLDALQLVMSTISTGSLPAPVWESSSSTHLLSTLYLEGLSTYFPSTGSSHSLSAAFCLHDRWRILHRDQVSGDAAPHWNQLREQGCRRRSPGPFRNVRFWSLCQCRRLWCLDVMRGLFLGMCCTKLKTSQ